MPTRLHRFDDATDDDFTAFIAKWRIQNSKVTLAVLATFEFVKNPVFERAEALRAPKKGSNR